MGLIPVDSRFGIEDILVVAVLDIGFSVGVMIGGVDAVLSMWYDWKKA